MLGSIRAFSFILDKGYQPQPSASADNPYLDLDITQVSPTVTLACLRLALNDKNGKTIQSKIPQFPF